MAEHSFAVDLLDVDQIVPNPRNVNQGDVGAIATAIAVDGFHGAVICQDRGKKDLPMIVVGEHRWRALALLQRDGIDLNGVHRSYEELLADKSLMLPPPGKVPGQVLKMDDTRAIRKMLADNRASTLATTDDSGLMELLADLASAEELLGSLFDGDDVDALIESIERSDVPLIPPEPKEPRAKADARTDMPVRCPGCGSEFIPGHADILSE